MTDKRKSCCKCGKDENSTPMITFRFKGITETICTHCMPKLVHGSHKGIMPELVKQ